MKVVVREAGDRPAITTPARLNAPQGAKALADLLADETFADLCDILIDWQGDGFTPALVINTFKWFPQYEGRRLQSQWILSLDDAFGIDNFDNALARQIVFSLREEFMEKSQTLPPGMESR